MDASQLFDVWAPEDSLWSRWAKPALFAAQAPTPTATPPPPPNAMPVMPVHPIEGGGVVVTAPPPPEPPQYEQGPVDIWTAFVVDMPEARPVGIGLALARAGYRPVPLFNTAYHPQAIVPVEAILNRLREGAAELQGLPIPANAPPAFLLDSNRLASPDLAKPGKFDNRWTVFPQDFPSANFLLAHGIKRVVLLQPDIFGGKPRVDLAHVLLRWQQAGVELYVQDPEGSLAPRTMTVEKPSSFRSLFYRALTLIGRRRNSAGGFGSIIPIAAAGTTGFS